MGSIAATCNGIVSMVPSWTETLLWAGLPVVGRTRFCIHPQEQVSSIPIVGGTKNWNRKKVQECRPDLIVLDKEENPRQMAEECEAPYWASHVRSIDSLESATGELAEKLGSLKLEELSARWKRVAEADPLPSSAERIPGVVEWGRKPTRPASSIAYVIWRDPWMAVGPNTFIASVLKKLGAEVFRFEENYPQFEPESLPADILLLFSSEPYPFLKKREGIDALGFPYAFVDGEKFSWFGIRSLRFLEQALGFA